MNCDVAYAAGLFDGEGCITTKWPKRKTLSIELAMVNKLSVEKYAKALGGKCKEHRQKNPKRKNQWRCRIYDNEAIEALTKMLPYLVGKREEAIAAIKFKTSMNDQERTELALSIKQLKLLEWR